MPTNGEKLAAWRKLNDLSQAQAAKKLSELCGWTVVQAVWSPWEGDRKSPDRETAPKVEELTDGAVRAADWPPRKRGKRRRPRGMTQAAE